MIFQNSPKEELTMKKHFVGIFQNVFALSQSEMILNFVAKLATFFQGSHFLFFRLLFLHCFSDAKRLDSGFPSLKAQTSHGVNLLQKLFII